MQLHRRRHPTRSQRNSSNSSNNNNNNNHKKPIMFIETLLDADDGLNNHAVEWIQTKAVQKTKEHRKQQNKQLATTNADTADTNADTNLVDPGASLNSTWWFLCGTDHIEWHNRNIYKLSTKEYSTFGLTSGLVGLRQSPLFCTSAGFTRIGITNSRSSSINASANVNSNSNSNSKSNSLKFPKDAYSNHALTFYFPECTHVHVAVDRNVDALPTNGNYSACWHREFPGESFVIKSRTITSDSMDHMNPRRADDDYRDISWLNKTDYPLLINETEHLWLDLMQNFSIDRSRAWETSVYLFRNRRRILRQNRDLRCSPGFPCYVEAQRNHIRMENYWYALEHESGAKIAQGKASSEILKKIMDMNAKRHTKPK
uniref:Uncharacterized protein n=1 Tax=Pseudo-nitzschia australis TaxID=44445 RepID=A0A7S4ASY2_9STRA